MTSKDEHVDLVQRFESVFNRIESLLREKLGRDKIPPPPFAQTVKDYQDSKRSFYEDAEYLKRIANIRNELVHDKKEPYNYFAIPTVRTVERMEEILARLERPRLSYY